MSSKLGVENIAHTNGTNAMTISSGGVATFPQIPCCFAQLTTANAQDTSNPYSTTGADIRFDQIITNQGNCYSESTGKFTVPIAGVYEVINTFLTNNDTTQDHNHHVRKNSVIIHRSYASLDSNHVQLFSQCLVDCSVGDTLSVQLTGGNIYIDSSGQYSAFSVKLVG